MNSQLFCSKNQTGTITVRYRSRVNVALKFECEGKRGTRCDVCECNEGIGPACTFALPPIPDKSRLPKYHYKHVRDTPAQINDCMREIDDLQLRIQIKKAVKEGDLSLDDEESVKKFSKSNIVERPLVIKCLKQTPKRIRSTRTKVCFRS